MATSTAKTTHHRVEIEPASPADRDKLREHFLLNVPARTVGMTQESIDNDLTLMIGEDKVRGRIFVRDIVLKGNSKCPEHVVYAVFRCPWALKHLPDIEELPMRFSVWPKLELIIDNLVAYCHDDPVKHRAMVTTWPQLEPVLPE